MNGQQKCVCVCKNGQQKCVCVCMNGQQECVCVYVCINGQLKCVGQMQVNGGAQDDLIQAVTLITIKH